MKISKFLTIAGIFSKAQAQELVYSEIQYDARGGTWQSENSWTLLCANNVTYATGGSYPNEKTLHIYDGNVGLPLGETCYVDLVDSYGDGWQDNYWKGWGQAFTLVSGGSGRFTFVVEHPSPPPPPNPPTPPPPPPASSPPPRSEALNMPIYTLGDGKVFRVTMGAAPKCRDVRIAYRESHCCTNPTSELADSLMADSDDMEIGDVLKSNIPLTQHDFFTAGEYVSYENTANVRNATWPWKGLTSNTPYITRWNELDPTDIPADQIALIDAGFDAHFTPKPFWMLAEPTTLEDKLRYHRVGVRQVFSGSQACAGEGSTVNRYVGAWDIRKEGFYTKNDVGDNVIKSCPVLYAGEPQYGSGSALKHYAFSSACKGSKTMAGEIYKWAGGPKLSKLSGLAKIFTRHMTGFAQNILKHEILQSYDVIRASWSDIVDVVWGATTRLLVTDENMPFFSLYENNKNMEDYLNFTTTNYGPEGDKEFWGSMQKMGSPSMKCERSSSSSNAICQAHSAIATRMMDLPILHSMNCMLMSYPNTLTQSQINYMKDFSLPTKEQYGARAPFPILMRDRVFKKEELPIPELIGENVTLNGLPFAESSLGRIALNHVMTMYASAVSDKPMTPDKLYELSKVLLHLFRWIKNKDGTRTWNGPGGVVAPFVVVGEVGDDDLSTLKLTFDKMYYLILNLFGKKQSSYQFLKTPYVLLDIGDENSLATALGADITAAVIAAQANAPPVPGDVDNCPLCGN